MHNNKKKDIGKRVVFRALCRWNTAKATRIIKGISSSDRGRYGGGPIVRFGGYANFYVGPHEVIEVLEEKSK